MPPADAEFRVSGRKPALRAGIVVAVALVLTACGGVVGQPDGSQETPWTPISRAAMSAEDAVAAADSVNAFGDLHTAIADDGDNMVTLADIASVLLAIVAAGAGTGRLAAEEMVGLLGLDGPRDTRYAALLADLVGADDVTLAIANSLWAAEGYPFEDDYVSFMQAYGATLDEVDLGSQDAADSIDDWVDERTEG